MRTSSRVAISYLLLSFIWIGSSDTILSAMFPEQFPVISLYKGWAFVATTALLLKFWLRQEERRRDAVQARLEDLAIFDPLTKLLNRGAFTSHLENAVAWARRTKGRLGLLFIDLDGFKAVNDTMGHAAGDTLLQAVVVRLQHALRTADIAARLGGDEFVVLVEPDTDNGLEILAERLLESFRAPFDIADRPVKVTLSIGVARFPHDGDEAELLIRSADMAMYRAKQGGRDAFFVAGTRD